MDWLSTEIPGNDSKMYNYTHIRDGNGSMWSMPTLDYLNDQKAMLYIPVVVFISILMFGGTIGNLFVLYIYNYKLEKRSASMFISAMAIFDLLGCVFAMPLEIYDLRYPYTFYNATGCKVLRFVEAFTVYGSAIILVQIAFDRYFRICRPLRWFPRSRVKMMCIVAALLAAVFSTPAVILFGITRSHTQVEGVLGYDCSIDERYKNGLFQKMYYNFLAFVFVSTFVILTGFYVRIWVKIKHRRDTTISDHITSPVTTAFRARRGTSTSEEEGAHKTMIKSKRLASVSESVNTIKLSRTTLIFLSVSVAFVVSYLPGVAIMIYRSVVKDYDTEMTPTEAVLLKLFARFNFLNNSINPVIYSLFNSNFRKQCYKVVTTFVFCCKSQLHKNRNSIRKRSKDSNSSVNKISKYADSDRNSNT